MQLKTILNRVQKHQSFIYADMELKEQNGQLEVEVSIRARSNSRPACSVCGRKCSGYDTLPVRRFEFIPFWGILVYFVYAMRRVDCPDCGIKVERVPWADGKRTVPHAYACFLARWAKQLSWSQVAEAFRTSWYTVYSSVEIVVQWGRAHVDLDGITAIGVDELCWGRWCTRAMRSRIEPMKQVAGMLRRHRELILNWFRAKKEFSSGVVEGLNAKAKLTTRKAYGFKGFKTLELALYHNLGALPQPIEAHKFF